MVKVITNELLFLQKKLELLNTQEYKSKFTEEQLNIFKKDIIRTMGLLLKKELNKGKLEKEMNT